MTGLGPRPLHVSEQRCRNSLCLCSESDSGLFDPTCCHVVREKQATSDNINENKQKMWQTSSDCRSPIHYIYRYLWQHVLMNKKIQFWNKMSHIQTIFLNYLKAQMWFGNHMETLESHWLLNIWSSKPPKKENSCQTLNIYEQPCRKESQSCL